MYIDLAAVMSSTTQPAESQIPCCTVVGDEVGSLCYAHDDVGGCYEVMEVAVVVRVAVLMAGVWRCDACE